MPSSIQAFLKSDKGLFKLGPKITTIGRERCDLTLQGFYVDQQHATIEYNPQDNCLILTDLDTSNGTYVNDIRVQNNSVKIFPNDNIKFGLGGQSFQLVVEVFDGSIVEHQQMSVPLPMDGSGCWQSRTKGYIAPPALQPATSLLRRPVSENTFNNLRERVQPPMLVGTPPGQKQSESQSTRMHDVERDALIQHLRSETQDLRAKYAMLGQLVKGQSDNSEPDQILYQRKTNADEAVQLVEKYCQLEAEFYAKDSEVAALKEQISRLRLANGSNGDATRHANNTEQLAQVERELEKAKRERNIADQYTVQLKKDLESKDSTISTLTREIETLKADSKEKDVFLKHLQDKHPEVQFPQCLRFLQHHSPKQRRKAIPMTIGGFMGKAMTKLSDVREGNEEIQNDAKSKELLALRQQFKQAESQLQQLKATFTADNEKLQAENELQRKECQTLVEKCRKFESERRNSKEKLAEMERLETQSRVEHQEATAKFLKLKASVVQAAYCVNGGTEVPDHEVDDEELFGRLSMIIEAHQAVRDKLNSEQESKSKLQKSKVKQGKIGQTIGKGLQETEELMKKSSGDLDSFTAIETRLAALKTEVTALQKQSDDDFTVDKVADDVGFDLEAILVFVTNGLASTRADKLALLSLFDKNPDAHRTEAIHEVLKHERARILNELSQRNTEIEELRCTIDGKNGEIASCKEDLAKVKEKFQTISQAHVLLKNQHERHVAKTNQTATEASKKSTEEITSLRQQINELQQAAIERNEELRVTKDTLAKTSGDLNTVWTNEQSIRNQLIAKSEAWESEKKTLISACEKHKEQTGRELEKYREQAKQHSITISHHEGKIKDLEQQLSATIQDNINQSKIIAEYKMKTDQMEKQTACLEGKIQENERKLKQDKAETVRRLKQENEAIACDLVARDEQVKSLKCELTQLSAKLTDLTGEMSEGHKRLIDSLNRDLASATAELEEVKVAHARLLRQHEESSKDSAHMRAKVTALENEVDCFDQVKNDHLKKIRMLQEKLAMTENQMVSDCHSDQEVMHKQAMNEFASIGAQCRGERHQEIIERQREAVADLRHRLNALEQSSGGGSCAVRANQAVALNNRIGGASSTTSTMMSTIDSKSHQVQLIKREIDSMKQVKFKNTPGLPSPSGESAMRTLSGDTEAVAAKLQAEIDGLRFELTDASSNDRVLRRDFKLVTDTLIDVLRNIVKHSKYDVPDGSSATELTAACAANEEDENLPLYGAVDVIMRLTANIISSQTIIEEGMMQQRHTTVEKIVDQTGEVGEIICERIRSLKERIFRKNELLANYEGDLSRLSQFKAMDEQKTEQLKCMLAEKRQIRDEQMLLQARFAHHTGVLQQGCPAEAKAALDAKQKDVTARKPTKPPPGKPSSSGTSTFFRPGHVRPPCQPCGTVPPVRQRSASRLVDIESSDETPRSAGTGARRVRPGSASGSESGDISHRKHGARKPPIRSTNANASRGGRGLYDFPRPPSPASNGSLPKPKTTSTAGSRIDSGRPRKNSVSSAT